MDRLLRRGQPINDYTARYRDYPAWNDVKFENLLARGAFEVSSELSGGEVTYLKITSKAGGRVKITSPYSLRKLAEENGYAIANNVIEFETEAGASYEFGKKNDAAQPAEDEVLSHVSYTKRRVFLGEDEHSEYFRTLDSFTRDWYLGNVRMENHNVYKFDFCACEEKKDFMNVLYRVGYAAEKMNIGTLGFKSVKDLQFTVKRGYGFASSEGIRAVDRGTPDEIRRDFVEGEGEAEFLIEVPRGQYELFVISGDEAEDSVTVLEAKGGRRIEKKVTKAGRYQTALLPIIHEEDGAIRLKVSTEKGMKWKINCILVNLYKQF